MNIEQALHFLNVAISSFLSLGPLGLVLLPGYFGCYQNLLRMILIGIATLITTPKEARPQALLRFSFTLCQLQQV